MANAEKIPGYLFVYGTLMKSFDNEFAAYLRAHSSYVGSGYMLGKLYDLGHYPGAIHDEAAGSRVYGHLFLIDDQEEVFPKLDAYEEVGPQFPEPNEYVRVLVPVFLADETYVSWAYLYNRPLEQATEIASGNYVDYVALGASQG